MVRGQGVGAVVVVVSNRGRVVGIVVGLVVNIVVWRDVRTGTGASAVSM